MAGKLVFNQRKAGVSHQLVIQSFHPQVDALIH
jgi:hypothetical protein